MAEFAVMIDLDAVLADPARSAAAYAWVELATARQQHALAGTALMLPPVAPGTFVTELNICQDYSCGCGWNATINGRDPEKHDALLSLAERPEDTTYGAFKILTHRENGKLWSVTLAGNEDLGLDAVIALLT